MIRQKLPSLLAINNKPIKVENMLSPDSMKANSLILSASELSKLKLNQIKKKKSKKYASVDDKDKEPSIIIIKSKPKITEEEESVNSHDSVIYASAHSKITKKLLSGFHAYFDEESDVVALQCCTCCIGCWRNCSHRCTGCENFISCPIYCWVGILLPLFIILSAALIFATLYYTGKISLG